jgi:hypothetical protein
MNVNEELAALQNALFERKLKAQQQRQKMFEDAAGFVKDKYGCDGEEVANQILECGGIYKTKG